MKVKRGVNPDWADFDELDLDALEAKDAYMDGNISFDELSLLIGPEEAESLRQLRFGEDIDEDDLLIDDLFDNPDDFE